VGRLLEEGEQLRAEAKDGGGRELPFLLALLRSAACANLADADLCNGKTEGRTPDDAKEAEEQGHQRTDSMRVRRVS
jgi:hypothetical protein